MKRFKKLSSKESVILCDYIKDYVSKNPETEVLIGCDSQNFDDRTVYAIVVGLYKPGSGAHVLFDKFETKRDPDGFTRLISEVWYSVEIAELIKGQLGIKAKWIDIDINPDPRYLSNKVLSSAIGIVTGMGYKVRHKHCDPMMTYASDKLIKS